MLTNDKYPIRKDYELRGPTFSRGTSIGANAVILPGVKIGEGAMVAAGACVTKDVPGWTLAIGFPAEVRDLPDESEDDECDIGQGGRRYYDSDCKTDDRV